MTSSYGQILRSSSIIGAASVINIALGLLRIKVAAILLGPAGVGMIGLMTSLTSTASAVSGLGFGSVGTRQIAESVGRNDLVAVGAVRRALFWGTMTLALLGAALFWHLRDVFALWVLGDAFLVGDVGWLAIAVGLTVAAASQMALLNGMRQIGNLARLTVLSGLLTTALGIGSLTLWGRDGLVAFIIAAPLSSFLLGHMYVARLPKIQEPRTPIAVLVGQWRVLATLGSAFMLAGLVGTLGQLLVRTMVQKQLGVDNLGYFQAASTISMTYIGFVLTAMGTDFYPRLTAAIQDSVAVNRLVNEQTEIAILLASPVLLAMMGLAPWLIELLYSSSFDVATEVLRLQLFGDVLKVASWPLGFIILAAGDGRKFVLTEAFAVSVFVLLTWFGLPLMGVAATGVAYAAMYTLHLPLMYLLAWRRTRFSWQRHVFMQLIFLFVITLFIYLVTIWSNFFGAVIGVVAALTFSAYTLARLAQIVNISGALGQVAKNSQKLMKLMGVLQLQNTHQRDNDSCS